MNIDTYEWPSRSQFLDRREELAAMEAWWGGRSRRLLAMLGRRRVGKSWLFRAFAHGKPAVVLVAERGTPGAQLMKLAASLEGPMGVRPAPADVPDLFRLLYRLGRDRKTLFAIDEFQHLLPAARQARAALLTGIQAVIEEEQEASHARLILCGSQIGQIASMCSIATARCSTSLPTCSTPGLLPLHSRAPGPRAGAGGRHRGAAGRDQPVARRVPAHADDELEAGMSAGDLWRTEVEPGMADHIAPAFEQICRR